MTGLSPAELHELVVINPDNVTELDDLAQDLHVDRGQLQAVLRSLRDLQRVERRIEAYWRNNPEPRTRVAPR